MIKFKSNRINYYVLASVLIHSFLLLFNENKKDLILGEKIIPIEVVDNLQETGFGEATERSKKLIKRASSTSESQKEKKDGMKLNQQKSLIEKKINKSITEAKVEKKKSRTNKMNQLVREESKGSGSREGIKNNEPEKGSLRGKGKVKVTCLKCIRPLYPPIALRRGAEGAPIVKVWINKNGNVDKAELISASGNESIDNAAKQAATNSTFYPLVEETSINIEYDLKIRY